MAELRVTSQTITGTTAVTRLEGELDSGNFDLLEDGFNQVLESGVAGLVLDMSGVEAFSSAGLGALLDVSRILASRDGLLVVAGMRPKIQGLVEMLELTDKLTLADTAEQGRKLVANIKS